MSFIRDFLPKIISRFIYPVRPFWTANIYGFGKWIRVYGFYPPILPLCIYTDHGPGEYGLMPHEFNSLAPVQLYHSIGNVRKWKKLYKKPCYVLYSPFVFARKKLKINYNSDAKGSIYFLAHSTPSLTENKSPDRYHRELLELPDQFKPVTICLHDHDVKKGLAEIYRSYGYKVLSAGDGLNPNFINNFYKILGQFKYALSNTFGSYGLYATEMKMPFGLYGTPPEYININDPNIPKGKYSPDNFYLNRAYKLFGHLPKPYITKKQFRFATYYLGLDYGISRVEMASLLYKSLFVWLFQVIVRFLKRLKLEFKRKMGEE